MSRKKLFLCPDPNWYELAMLWSYSLAGSNIVDSTQVDMRIWVITSFHTRRIVALLTELFPPLVPSLLRSCSLPLLFHVPMCSAFPRHAPCFFLPVALRVFLGPRGSRSTRSLRGCFTICFTLQVSRHLVTARRVSRSSTWTAVRVSPAHCVSRSNSSARGVSRPCHFPLRVVLLFTPRIALHIPSRVLRSKLQVASHCQCTYIIRMTFGLLISRITMVCTLVRQGHCSSFPRLVVLLSGIPMSPTDICPLISPSARSLLSSGLTT